MKELNTFRQFLAEGDKDHKHTYKQIDPDGTSECTKCGLRKSDPSKTGEKVIKENDKNDSFDVEAALKQALRNESGRDNDVRLVDYDNMKQKTTLTLSNVVVSSMINGVRSQEDIGRVVLIHDGEDWSIGY